MAVGLGGVIALFLGMQAGDWSRPEFLALFSILVFLAAIGGYICAAVYVPGLPLPPTRAERTMTPRLRVYTAAIEQVYGTRVLLQLGLSNEGRGRITAASVNVLVPEHLRPIERCDQFGLPLEGADTGRQSWTPEHVELDTDGDPIPSVYWNGFVDFTGRTARPLYFTVQTPDSRVVNVRLGVVAEELDEPLKEYYALRLPDGPPTPQAELELPANVQEPDSSEQAS